MHVTKPSTPILITEPNALHRVIGLLKKQPIIAVDTEANSLFAYKESVCLIQFSTPDEDFLVDPISLKDVSPLAGIFADPKIEKVFHAAEYDLMIMKHDFSFEFNNIFDTMVAARILGRDAVGLGSMLEAEFGVKVNKKFQRANWGKRPLSREMMAYAQMDTHYLIPLRQKLHKELQKSGRWVIASEDFVRACNVTPNNEKRTAADVCWRINGVRDLSPQQAAVLQELCAFRDKMARRMNRPLFKVISDKILLTLSQGTPKSIRELRTGAYLSEKQISMYGSDLIKAIRRGSEKDPIRPPRKKRHKEDYLIRLDRIRQWRKEKARQMGVVSDIILPRDIMVRLAEKNPGSMDELRSSLNDVPWRLKTYGEEILMLLMASS